MQEISLVLPAPLNAGEEAGAGERERQEEMGRKEQAKEANVGQREADK